ncbi:sugar nucleotide-binding protein [Candidatus Gottesmanbacteria bacterium]|nr:sugar nucleotide-binding protein [Candidatus Gottesmanbacteria bacterium]
MKLLGTGLSGLVGSRIVALLSQHTFTNFSLENGVDITDSASITPRITGDTDSPWVLHLAAYTNVQQAEADALLGENSTAWKVNVAATQTLVDACRITGKHLLYIDTDYAFDGAKDVYSEEDTPHPLGWYAKTKSEGAIAAAIDALMSRQASGIYHVVGSEALSPYIAAGIVAKTYGLDEALVKPTTFASYFAGKAPIPQKAVLTNGKIRALGVSMRGFADGVSEMKRQEENS